MISVVLPVRDGMPWLEEQLRALDAQECSVAWEVIVAENGSTDGSHELIRAWCTTHEHFRLVDASASAGAASARNEGVKEARGDLLAFCDADDIVLAGWLEALVGALHGADAVAGVFDFWSLNGNPPTAPSPPATRQLGFLPAGLGANLAVRRPAFEQVGGFLEDIMPGEDIDLCWRLQLEGFRFAVAHQAVVAKRERSEFWEVFEQAFAYGQCGPVLYKRFRSDGAHRDLRGAAKSWLWLGASAIRLLGHEHRLEWARTAGMRLGRWRGSFTQGTFFP